MIGGLPLNPDGHDAEGIHAKWVNDEFTLRRKLAQTDGIGISQTTRGDFVSGSFLTDKPGLSLKSYRLFDVSDDFLVCTAPPALPPSLAGLPQFIGSFSNADLESDHITLILRKSATPPTPPDVTYSPVEFDVYFNVSQNLWFAFDGSSWVNMVGDLRFSGSSWQRYDGTTWITLSTFPAIFVAKEAKHRTSLLAERFMEATHTYTYDDGDPEFWQVDTAHAGDGHYNLTRHDYDGSSTEDQRIVPPWTQGEIIRAVRDANTGVSRPTSMDDPTPVSVGLHIFGRSSQWCQIA